MSIHSARQTNVNTVKEEIHAQIQNASQHVITARYPKIQLAKLSVDNSAQRFRLKTKDSGKIKSKEEQQFEQTLLRESRILEMLRFKLDLLETEKRYKRDLHDRCMERTELNLEKERCQASLENQTRGLIALERRIDAGEGDEGVVVARSSQDETIKRNCIIYGARVFALEERTEMYEHMCTGNKKLIDAMWKSWAKREAESL